MRMNKLIHLLTPPAIGKLFDKLAAKKKRLVPMDSEDKFLLNRFKEERLNFFFQENIIDEFCELMEEHFHGKPPIETKDQSNQEYLNELVKNGFCKIEGIFSKEQIKYWHDSLHAIVRTQVGELERLQAEHGVASGKYIVSEHNGAKLCYDLRGGYMRLWAVPGTEKFRENSVINDICNSYLSGISNESQVWYEFKAIPFCKDGNLALHSDSIFKQIKVFLVLHDIDYQNAPFIYYKRSHNLSEWRLLNDFLEFTNYNKKYFSSFVCWGDIGMGRLAEKYENLSGLESIVTAQAGDVIIADTRGVHGGSLLLSGYRLQLCMSFSMLGNFHNSYLPKHILNLSKNVN